MSVIHVTERVLLHTNLIMLIYVVGVFQVNVTPLPEALSNCVRPDARVPPAYSQSCTSYRADKQISYGFLYPPRESHLSETQSYPLYS